MNKIKITPSNDGVIFYYQFLFVYISINICISNYMVKIMKLKSILCEKLVQSSWLEDISYYNRHNKLFPGEEIITFKVRGNPKTYIVRGLTRHDYIEWIKSPSKGKMYHKLKHYFARGWYDTNPFKIIDRSKIKPTKK